MNDSDMCHVASASIDAPSDFVFEHLADPVWLGRWSLGSMDLQPTEDPLVHRGVSLFDGSDSYIEIRAQRALGLIDYFVGDREKRAPRIFVRVAPGALCGLSDGQCGMSLIAWRHADMSPQRWSRLCKTHEAEVLLIKAQIETRFQND